MARQNKGAAWRLRERVQQCLAERGWNDTEFQRQTGMPRSTLDRIGRSERPPQRRTVARIAEVFDIDLTEALQLAGILPFEYAGQERRKSDYDRAREIVDNAELSERERQLRHALIDRAEINSRQDIEAATDGIR